MSNAINIQGIDSLQKSSFDASFFLFHTIASNNVTAPLKPHCIFLLSLASVLFWPFSVSFSPLRTHSLSMLLLAWLIACFLQFDWVSPLALFHANFPQCTSALQWCKESCSCSLSPSLLHHYRRVEEG